MNAINDDVLHVKIPAMSQLCPSIELFMKQVARPTSKYQSRQNIVKK